MCESLQEERQKLTHALHQSNGTQVAQLCQLKAADATKDALAAENHELHNSLDRYGSTHQLVAVAGHAVASTRVWHILVSNCFT